MAKAVLLALMCLLAFVTMGARSLHAQAFAPIPPLSFTMPFGGANPLPQVLTVASTGTNFAYHATATTTSGGAWLSLNPSSLGCCTSTPSAIQVVVTAPAGLAAGSYSGQVVLASNSSAATTLTVPVTLVVAKTGVAFFDTLPGQVSFSFQTGATAPPAQALQIRNGGSGALAWTLAASTGTGSGWLSVSAASGSGAAIVSVSINSTKLPGAGLVAGSYIGMITLSTSGDKVTVPVAVVVGDSVFRQSNALNFVKLYGGANPMSQALTVASTGAAVNFSAVAINSNGGNWLQITPSSFGCCTVTPTEITVTANPAVALAAGTYTAEIIVIMSGNKMLMTIPVTLVVAPPTAAFFDSLPGGMNFTMETGGTAPPGQAFQIRNGGAGSLSWTLTTSTSDGGTWLHASAASGGTPATVTITVVPEDLPGNGLTPGSFTGQVVLQTATGRATIPVSLVVGDSVFRQANPISFAKVYGGANPLAQVLTVASTGADIPFYATVVNSTGGSWLQISPSSFGCCTTTPQTISVSVNPAASLAAGTYEAEIVVRSNDGSMAMTVPVSLTIFAPTATFFDDLPGQLTFSMVTKGTAPPAQAVQIRNAGAGTLSWTASVSTSDGGAWLAISAASGNAPSALSVSVKPASLPGAGLIAGTYLGQVVLQSATSRVTIPVSMVVGDNVFRQMNAVSFTKVYGGANPLPQVLTIASTGTAINLSAVAINSTGGNWLTIAPSSYGCCSVTPRTVTLVASPAASLAAGTYMAEVIVRANNGSQGLTVPVTLTVEPPVATFLDDFPGQLSFYLKTGAASTSAFALPIRNGGKGTLNWTLSTSTADGAKWLTVSTASGTAPSSVNVGVLVKSLPGAGLIAGTFSGQVVVQTAGDQVTIPISVIVGANVFTQLPALSFAKTYGGANPATQTFTVSSTGTAFSFAAVAFNAKGGNWLTINPASYGCCTATPKAVIASVAPVSTLAAGVYTGEIIIGSNDGTMAQTIPVSLTVTGTAHAATPTFTPPGGNYTTAQSVVIADATPGSGIYYTTDGTTPTTASKVYSAPISVTSTETIKAIAIAPGYPQSATATATYNFTTPKAATPTVTQTITIAEATAGATVYYTTDGTTPTTSSHKYTGPITISASMVLKFIAVAPNYQPSAVRTVTDTVQ